MKITSNKKSKIGCIVITGVAGFIGSHLAHSFLQDGITIIGIDCLSKYYSIEIKQRRLSSLKKYQSFYYYSTNISDIKSIRRIFNIHIPDLVVHLAAQPGVVSSKEMVSSYIESNIYGAKVIIQLCAKMGTPLIYASSSSVYGDCTNIPFLESEDNLLPKSLYAKTKLYNEKIVAFYTKKFNLKAIGLRFFSIYGEDMRPDMAISLFTSAIYHHKPITLYGDHNTARDFTYIKDLILIIKMIAQKLYNGEHLAPIYNIGNQKPITIEKVVNLLEKLLNKTSQISHMPLRPGEAQITYSDSSLLYKHFGLRPTTTIEEGLEHYIKWYMKTI